MRRPLLLLAMVAQSAAHAQPTPLDSARIREEIVTTLLEFEWSYSSPLSVRLTAGGHVPDSLVPPGMKVLGGTGTGTLILHTLAPLGEAEAQIRTHLLGKGHWLVDMTRRPRWMDEGFVFPSNRPSTPSHYKQYCSSEGLLAVNVRPQWPGRGPGSVVYLRHSGQYSTSPCRLDQARAETPESPQDIEIAMPLLRAPPGATSSGGSGMRGGGSADGSYQRVATAQVRSAMTPGDLVAFYSQQLTADGWSVGQPAVVTDGAIVSARKKDAEGRDLIGILSAVRSPAGTHYLTFQIERAAQQRERRR